MKPSPKKPTRLVLAVVLIALAVGTLLVFRAIRERERAAQIAYATMRMQPGGAAVQFPVSIDTQRAADVANWSASAVGSSEAVSVRAASIGTDDRTVFLEIFDLKPGMRLKVRYNLRSADGSELQGTLTGNVN